MTSPDPTHRPVYLDCHATTPVDPRVRDAMWPWFSEKFGNAASTSHAYGWEAAEGVKHAREQVAGLLGVDPRTLIFTSGATESNNLALKGVLPVAGLAKGLACSAVEHRSVLDPARRLQRRGHEVVFVPVDRYGRIDLGQFESSLRPSTVLASVMLANNEVGAINPIEAIGEICRRRGIWLHCDAAQAVGRIPLDLGRLPIDLLSLSGHKIYGPKGIGVLYVRRDGRRIPLEPLLDGGGQEQRLRSGTLAVPLIVGLGTACELAGAELPAEAERIGGLRDRLWDELQRRIPGVVRNTDPTASLPGCLHVSFAGISGTVLLTKLTRIAVSSGSACTTADPEPSHVLRAMGVPEALANASLRFGLGRFTTREEIELAAAHVEDVWRGMNRDSARPNPPFQFPLESQADA